VEREPRRSSCCCDPKLCERIGEDLGRVGLVGELDNKLISYHGGDEPQAGGAAWRW
jgi:hypothetical protein